MRRGIGGSVDKHGDASFVRDLPNDNIWLIRIGGILAHLVNRHGHYPLADRIKELQVPDDDDPVAHSSGIDTSHPAFKDAADEDMVRWDLKNLQQRILRGHDMDWETLEPLITDHSPSDPAMIMTLM